MKRAIIVLALLFAAPAMAAYTGPGDIVSGWYGFWSLWAFNAAQAAAQANAITIFVPNSPGSLSFNIPLCSTGVLNTPVAVADAGVDMTMAATISATTMTVSSFPTNPGGRTKPSAGDTLTGAGLTQPAFIVSCGTFTAGAGTCTLNPAQSVAVSETITATNAMFVSDGTETNGMFDQSANGLTMVRATLGAGFGIILVPSWINGNPGIYSGGGFALSATPASSQTPPFSASWIAERTTGNTSVYGPVFTVPDPTSNGTIFGFAPTANEAVLWSGTEQTAGATENAIHAVQEVANGTSSIINVDGSDNAVGSPGAQVGTRFYLTAQATNASLGGYLGEAGFNTGTFSSGTRSALAANAAARLAATWSCSAASGQVIPFLPESADPTERRRNSPAWQ